MITFKFFSLSATNSDGKVTVSVSIYIYIYNEYTFNINILNIFGKYGILYSITNDIGGIYIQRKHFVTFITFQLYDCQFHSVKPEAICLGEEKNQ